MRDQSGGGIKRHQHYRTWDGNSWKPGGREPFDMEFDLQLFGNR